MQINTIEITLIAWKKAGVLTMLMHEVGSLGLIYRRCSIEDEELEGREKLTLVCEGTLGNDENHLIQVLENIQNVHSVINITQVKSVSSQNILFNNDALDELQEQENALTKLHPLRASDKITHDVLQIVEDRLSDTFGPVAPLLLKSAAKKSNRVGDLFLILAEELKDDKKENFLKNVEGLESFTD